MRLLVRIIDDVLTYVVLYGAMYLVIDAPTAEETFLLVVGALALGRAHNH